MYIVEDYSVIRVKEGVVLMYLWIDCKRYAAIMSVVV